MPSASPHRDHHVGTSMDTPTSEATERNYHSGTVAQRDHSDTKL